MTKREIFATDGELIIYAIANEDSYGTISTYRDLGFLDNEISKKIQGKYHLTSEETLEYLQAEMA